MGPKPTRVIPNTNEIFSFTHCLKCLAEIPEGESPQSYSRLEVGFTLTGFQVWCLRHDCNVLHIDFEGRQHPFNADQGKAKPRRAH